LTKTLTKTNCRYFRIPAGLVLAALCFAPAAWAQGCVLCYTSLAASGPAGMRAFQFAMFALLIPALLLFLGVFFLVFRRARAVSTPLHSRQKNRIHFPIFTSRIASAKAAPGRA
jgi:hypothetical protein